MCLTSLGGVSDNGSRPRRRLAHLVSGQHDHFVRPVDGLAGDGQRVGFGVDRSLLHVVLGSPTRRCKRRRIIRQTAPPDDVVKSRRVLLFCRDRLQRTPHSPPFQLLSFMCIMFTHVSLLTAGTLRSVSVKVHRGRVIVNFNLKRIASLWFYVSDLPKVIIFTALYLVDVGDPNRAESVHYLGRIFSLTKSEGQ